MIVLGLITCIVLRALTAQAKVVDSFEECKGFFYKGIEPRGMDQNAKKICQKLENNGFYYASLYSVHHKIPLYSAYTFDPTCKSSSERTDDWHLEPQISQPQSSIDHMVPDNSDNQNLYRENQAISSDYSYTGYDRGHLNPSGFQCSKGRDATYTLTNAAPMIGRFNQVHWKNMEMTLRGDLLKQLIKNFGLATAFIITGTVPDPNVRIPQNRRKVTVPSHIWTAVCYKHLFDNTESFSYGYIGRNHPDQPDIRLMSVSDLNDELKSHFRTQQLVKIFADDCFGDDDKLVKVQGVFQKLINLVSQAVQMSSGVQNTYLPVKRTFSGDSTPEKRVNVNEKTGKIAFDSMSTYYSLAEDLMVFAGIVCPITHVKRTFVHDELKKREVSAEPDAVECQLDTEKTAADGSPCSSTTQSDDSCQCYTEGESKLCCSSPCLYQDDVNGYKCYSEQKLIDCSPQYSRITVNGEKCLDDHPCATYGEDYYWCKTKLGYFKDDWGYCSPPLRYSKTKKGTYCRNNHACAKYGKGYTWCYTDDEGSWDYC